MVNPVHLPRIGFVKIDTFEWGDKFQDERLNTIYTYPEYDEYLILDRAGEKRHDGAIPSLEFLLDLLQSLELN